MRTLVSISIYILLFHVQISIFAQTDWRLEKEEDGIKVYTKYESGSDYKIFKAETSVKCNIEDIIKALKNVSGYTKWVADCKKAELLKKDDNSQYHYIETSLPWPFENRDLVYHFKYTKPQPNKIKVIVTGKPDYIQPKKGIVRMNLAKGYWLLTQTDTDNTSIIYQMQVEPGGSIPAWLANATVVEMPYSTLTELRKILLKSN